MTNEIRNKVLLLLENKFTTEQLQEIDLAVAKAMRGYKIEKEETLPSVRNNEMPIEIKEFIARKRLKGCSKGTIYQYTDVLSNFAYWLKKDLSTVKDLDVLMYLDWIKTTYKISDRTLDTRRLILSSFYSFMHSTGKISYNPMATIDRIKFKEKVREPLSDMELEMARNACQTLREKALFEVLYSTGARVSEIVEINYTEIDKEHRSVVILGKGNCERHVYFNAKSMLAINNYLATRNDDNPALFIQTRAPYHRLGKSSIEQIIRNIGERSGIGRRVFPHLMRHTMATDALSHGAKINEVSALLGHKKLETTKIYAKISNATLQKTHAQFVC